MTAFRRTESNFALQHARDWAIQLKRPLVVLEGLRSDYPWASDRFHRFVIEGMQDNGHDLAKTPALYYPYVEPTLGAGKGLLVKLAAQACLVVGDDFPCFFHPSMFRRLADKLPTRFDLVDANCLMPLSLADRTFTVAHSYRRWMQKQLPLQLEHTPELRPMAASKTKSLPPAEPALIATFVKRWPVAPIDRLLKPSGLNGLPIDKSVAAADTVGGSMAAKSQLKSFLASRIESYDQDRNTPDLQGSTALSAHLHFGHISPHYVFWSLMEQQGWNPSLLSKPNGKNSGFWGVSPSAEALLDQLCTWREIGFNMCWREANYDQYDSLPDWARSTLAKHAGDPRPNLYSLEQMELAKTHDPIWNAAQRQLVREGRIHNYLRMLWGKKILQWSPTPQTALQSLIHLNNKYALDGRDPNSYSGIFWCLGRYDRAWGPERPIFGSVRYMTSENTAKKHSLKQYLQRFSSTD
jgi:deoxyribodipyrimidine photo-lyase